MHEGEVFKTNNCGDLIIVKYVNAMCVHVKFVDTNYETIVSCGNIKKGVIKDRLLPSVRGVGVIGDEPSRVNGQLFKEYMFWANILTRCYNEKYQVKKPTYKGCTVSENFKFYSNFKEWCQQQIGYDREGWHLDKDILVKGNKIYSEDTCCFVPPEINSLLNNNGTSKRGKYPLGVTYHKGTKKLTAAMSMGTGVKRHLGCFDTELEAFLVYKTARESYIKVVANKWKDQIDPRVYEALMNWTVDITD